MESIYNDLTTKILDNASVRESKRYITAIAGGPGSGKTTVANAIVRRINTTQENERGHAELAVCVSMDGFHLQRTSLDALPNREEAYIRRGAPWTFDVDGIVQFVGNLKRWAASTPLPTPADGGSVATEDHFPAPTFSHSLKDPVPNSLLIPASVTIIILEGNYLLLDQPLWRDIAPQIDFRVFIRVDSENMRERVARRHVRAGIEPDLESGFRRVDGNDAINGRMVKHFVVKDVDMIIESVEDAGETMDK